MVSAEALLPLGLLSRLFFSLFLPKGRVPKVLIHKYLEAKYGEGKFLALVSALPTSQTNLAKK